MQTMVAQLRASQEPTTVSANSPFNEEKHADERTTGVDRWAMRIMLETGAMHEYDQHGWAKQSEMPMSISGKGEGNPKVCR